MAHAQPPPRSPELVVAAVPQDLDVETVPSAHTAPHDEIIAVVHELMQRSPGRAVTIDTLANALKSRGFSRTPGSPRLITRLRRIREISVNRAGVITLLGEGAAVPPVEPVPVELPATAPSDAQAPAMDEEPHDRPLQAEPRPSSRRRRSRRGGRRRHPIGSPTA